MLEKKNYKIQKTKDNSFNKKTIYNLKKSIIKLKIAFYFLIS